MKTTVTPRLSSRCFRYAPSSGGTGVSTDESSAVAVSASTRASGTGSTAARATNTRATGTTAAGTAHRRRVSEAGATRVGYGAKATPKGTPTTPTPTAGTQAKCATVRSRATSRRTNSGSTTIAATAPTSTTRSSDECAADTTGHPSTPADATTATMEGSRQPRPPAVSSFSLTVPVSLSRPSVHSSRRNSSASTPRVSVRGVLVADAAYCQSGLSGRDTSSPDW